jgi:hypothetical protein
MAEKSNLYYESLDSKKEAFLIGTVLFSSYDNSKDLATLYGGTWECIGAMSFQTTAGEDMTMYMCKRIS